MTALEKASACRFCGEPLERWRCPACGRPAVAVGCLTALLPTVLIVTLLGFFVPGEGVPLLRALPGGGTEYVFQSMREAVLVPAGLAILAAFIALIALLFRPRRRPDEKSGAAARAGRGLGWTLALAAAALAVLGLAGLTVAAPTTRFRRAVVTAERVELYALLGSWSLARSEVAAARLNERVSTSGDRRVYDFAIEVETSAGEVLRSVPRRAGAADMARWHQVMNGFVEELKRGAPRPASAVGAGTGAPRGGRAPAGRGAGLWGGRTCFLPSGRGASEAVRSGR